ncbi:MAG TPA: DUF3971 domain-containing protein, partial [Pseudolabrys sp.]|nr:DUF3971 domain-containing protein [Pseudolabrys sp.]
MLALGILWWRLASGPIALDVATPWITAAVEQNFGARHKVEVGGTILERDESGRAAVRIRDIVVREPDGAIVASAPRAEVGLSSASLLTGRPRAESLRLVGAELSVRIGADGQFTLMTREEVPATTASTGARAPEPQPVWSVRSKAFLRDAPRNFAALLAWIDSLSALGLDGYDLNEIGLKNGRIVVDDQRNGQRSVFDNITLSLTRPRAGEVVFKIGSEQHERPWLLLASVKTTAGSRRAVSIEARKISLRDVLLALRLGDGQLAADVPFSATVRAEIGADGTPETVNGRMVVGPGMIGDIAQGNGRIAINRAEIGMEWDASRRLLAAPFQIISGANRFTLMAQAVAPREAGGPWMLSLSGGSIVLAPVDRAVGEPLVLNRIAIRGRLDPNRRRLDLDHGDIGGKGAAVAVSGSLDFSGDEPRLAMGLAAQQMSVAAFKQMWPLPVIPGVRAWIVERLHSGSIERVEIATNAPLSALQSSGPPIPDDGLSVEIVASRATIQPVEGLPPITDADLVARINGRSARVALGRGTVELTSGRRLTVSNGLFEVPDAQIDKPAARVRLRVDGPVPAAAELLAAERLRAASGAPLDPAASRGTVTAQVTLSFSLDTETTPLVTYNVSTDITNFAVDRLLVSQRVEAQTLRVAANNLGYQVRGDVRIGGTPASIEYRKQRDESDAQFRLQATLDDAARSRFGFDLQGAVSGPVPVKLAGRLGAGADQDSRFTVEADLTQARIENLLPGWIKPAGKPVRAAFTYVGKPKSTRFEDFMIEGAGTLVRGSIEIDANGEVVAANLPAFALSDGDKATLKAERASDGLLKVTMRGDVYDGRNFIKSSMAGGAREQKNRTPLTDLDLDIRLGAVAGFNGEVLRGVDLRVVRRGGQVRGFVINGKVGIEAQLVGELRAGTGGR